jgi:hypothetical protein
VVTHTEKRQELAFWPVPAARPCGLNASRAWLSTIGRMLRRAVLITAIAVCTCVAVYQFTVAEALALAAQFGVVEAHLIVGAIYAFACLVGLSAVSATRNRPSRVAAPATLANQREMQLIMLVEAVMLGYTLARRVHRSTS